jgi:hypothetical protein
VVVVVLVVAAWCSPAGATLRVESTDGLVSVAADDVPRAQILEEIARRTAIDIVGLESLGGDAMTLHVARVPPLEAIRRLLDGVPAVIVEHRAEDGAFHVASVHIFGRPESEDLESAGPVLDDSVRRALWQGDDHEADVAQDALEARDPAAMVREVLIVSRSESAEQRLRALRLLDRAGSVDRATTVAALGEAAADDDAAVKAFAIRALAVRGEEGRAMLRRVFRDGGRDDRLMVLQAMSERDDDATLVREALDDTDPEVRRFAAFRLSRPDTPGGG